MKILQESPFACQRLALSLEQRQRKDALTKIFQPMMNTNHDLTDGFEFELPADASTFQPAPEWAMMERAGCPFFDIVLRLERAHCGVLLGRPGSDGVKT